ncbi:MAG TPA: hypothetical protein VKU41_26005, partial [Polyangiaceae bacterium]|nr:hypothetical protein [Polyangiaceae bacterium]
ATQALKQSEREVLEHARRRKLPVQLLVNKADRMSPADLARVMEGLQASLEQTGLSSWAAPIALSAKRALAGKLGDEGALRESGWAAVESLLEEQIVARSGELKERAIRRRAASLVGRLVEAWRARADGEEARTQTEAARARVAGQAAARIDRDAKEIADHLASSLEPHAAAWARDLRLVFVGRDADAAARDPVLARYRADRALTMLAPPLSHAMAALAPEARVAPTDLLHVARAIVRTASSGLPGVEPLLAAIAQAAVTTFTETLFALSTTPARSSTSHGVLRELGAFADALAS